MNAASTFHCPSCSAPLDAPVEGGTLHCPYCGNTIIPPDSLVAQRAEVETQQVSVVTSGTTIDFQEYRDLLAQGQNMEAIKRLHTATGIGLKQSQEIIEALERGEDMSALAALLGGILPDQQAAEMVQAIDLGGQGIPPATIKRTVNISGALLTCGMLALIGFILLATIVPIIFAFVVGGGPLAPLWSQVDPLSPVGIELRFGESGIGAGQFDDPRPSLPMAMGISTRRLQQRRLQSFDRDGKFRWLANLGEENYVQGLDIARDGALLVVARGALRRFNPADGLSSRGRLSMRKIISRMSPWLPTGASRPSLIQEGILVLDPDYQPLLHVPQAVSTASGDSELEANIDIDGLGNLYVRARSTMRYSIFLRRALHQSHCQPGRCQRPAPAPGDLAIDGQGRIYVSDFNGVQIFDGDGHFLDKFDLGGYVFGLNFDLQDKLYTVSNDPEVMRLSVEK